MEGCTLRFEGSNRIRFEPAPLRHQVTPKRTQLLQLAREKPRFAYRRLHVLLRRCGEQINHKRLHRIYREAGLMIRRKKRKHCVREGKPLVARSAANQEWALDFVRDAVACGRTIRVLSIDRAGAHSAGQADAERTGGEFSRTAARRMFEPELVSESIRRAAQDRGVASGVQRGASAQQLRIQNTAGWP